MVSVKPIGVTPILALRFSFSCSYHRSGFKSNYRSCNDYTYDHFVILLSFLLLLATHKQYEYANYCKSAKVLISFFSFRTEFDFLLERHSAEIYISHVSELDCDHRTYCN